MKRWIVINLMRACVITHYWPVKHIPGINYCWMADLSFSLDERWGTGVWVPPVCKRFLIEKGLVTIKEPFWWPMQAPPLPNYKADKANGYTPSDTKSYWKIDRPPTGTRESLKNDG